MVKTLLIILVVVVAGASYFVISSTKEMYKVLPVDAQAPEVTTEAPVAKSHKPVTNFVSWHEYSSPNGDFRVMFPALPQQTSQKIIDQKTQEPRFYEMYVSEKDDGTIFMITAITFPSNRDPKTTEKMLTKAMNDMIESDPKNHLKKNQVTDYKNMKALDFSIENDKVSIDGKAFMIGDTLYVLTSLGNNQSYNDKEFNFFANSFDYLKK